MTVETPSVPKCPACGSELSRDRSSEGLCPACLVELALESPSLLAELEGPDEDATLAYSREAYSPGQVLGRRYRIRSLLGRGGMGEVWRATDLKLRVDVALKALRRQLLEDTRALETLRQEVRVAREVMSPNVCRVFDLVELDGQELVSMEYIDGITLLEIMKLRAPFQLSEAREIAAQFLAGLQAIHDAGLVHRDVKPENLMMTRSGRVVLMDFGIAKGLADAGAGTVSGTPAYMSPEQARGEALDARADVFSAGVVLAEMIAPSGVASHKARQKIWEGVHHEPPEIFESPWSRVLKTSVSRMREQRPPSAAALSRALEEVTLRVDEAEGIEPYPGLAAFTEADAEYFFGRELEVEALWRRLQRPHLLGLIGPSGAGKSSFLRAGLLPVIPTGWRAVVTTPGSRPVTALGQALAEELSGDPEAVRDLLRFEEMDVAVSLVSRWRERHDQALLIVDQFEELFTQNPPEGQRQFAELLGRLALEADVHVLLSMRDDFLGFCSQHESLAPIFSELTPLKPLTGGAVRRALVQPALKCGYKFEDDSLVDEMVGEVSEERGALPLLAFAAARLWDHRDREQGLLTREAYEHIGGVGGALAQHAEATLERIGDDRIPIVRELFRNLVTAQGTRAARDREELLSVFDGNTDVGAGLAPAREGARPSPTFSREDAEVVLSALIDARLLTSYEVPAADEEDTPHHRIEIIHESLLSNWPRLVRWQTQDADSAQLRDQIRQAAQMWEERGRPQDLLWTGTSFGEYQLWRERYEGGLSTAEEEFGDAMVHRAERQKRRRRIAISAAFGILLVVLGVIAWFGWQAEVERRRAEAGKLLALGEVELDSYPTATLAWATKSLELADSQEGRRLALRALHEGSPVMVSTTPSWWNIAFSPNGKRLAHAAGGDVRLLQSDGNDASIFSEPSIFAQSPRLAYQSDEVLVVDWAGELRWFSVPEGEELRRVEGDRGRLYWPRGDGYFSFNEAEGQGSLVWWPFGEGNQRSIGSMSGWRAAELAGDTWESAADWSPDWSAIDIDPAGTRVAYSQEKTVYLRSVEDWSEAPLRLGEHTSSVVEVAIHPSGDSIAARDESGELRIWRTDGRATAPTRSFQAEGSNHIRFDPSGHWLAAHGVVDGALTVRLWDLRAPQGADPVTLKRTDSLFDVDFAFHPSQPLLVTSNHETAGLWSYSDRQPWVLRGHEGRVDAVAFSPDGEWLVSAARDGARAWPLREQSDGSSRILLDRPLVTFTRLAFHPSGEQFAVGSREGTVLLVSLDGGHVRELPGSWTAVGGGMILDFSPDGRHLAATPIFAAEGEMVVRVWDLVSGGVQVLDPGLGKTPGAGYLGFDDSRYLRWVGRREGVNSGEGGERVFDLEDGSRKIVADSGTEWARAVSSSNDFMVVAEATGPHTAELQLFWKSLESGESRPITSHGTSAWLLALDPSDRWMATSGFDDSVVRVGPVSGEEPHLLLGHRGTVFALAVSPDGRWIASGGDDGTVRLWPTPDFSKPPLHTLAHDELIAKLKSLTNLRVVEDPESPSGWKLDYDTFPGWEEVPEW